MSGAIAKATRRDLRRAFGSSAVSTITTQSEQLRHIDRALQGQAKALELQRQAIVALVEWRNRSLFGRLRWLVTGR